jgi:arylsulfatase A
MRYLLSLLVVLLATLTASAGERRPNVIVIYADDMGWGDVGFNGRKDYHTPNLDKFVAQGIRCARWYTGAVVCAPSRGVLLTGKYTIHNGVIRNNDDLPRSEVTIADALKSAGYVTALFGKWHHGAPRPGEKSYVHPMDQGFDEFFGYTNAKDAWQKFPKQMWHGREQKAVDGYADTLFTDKSVDFVRRNKDRPFFLYLAFVAPHFHVEAPAADVADYAGKFKETDPKKPVNANYAAMITRLDKEVGRLLRTLDELKLADNTLIIFTSDHGATFESGNLGASAFHDSNRPFRGQKRTLWEGGIRVPGLVRWPAQLGRKTHTDPVHMIDVFPTVLAAAGVKVDPKWQVDGMNLLPIWQGKELMPARTLFWEWRAEGHYQVAAMRGPIKFVITGSETSRPELFNVEEDPGERRNRAAEFPEMTKRLQKELNDWLRTQTK